ncbi:MAG: DUF4160 domain-containing protein [Deltaproteobacteria bacterium]|nr:DUF4160 domain-containing protein [Deltaproteobacteria bacterium]
MYAWFNSNDHEPPHFHLERPGEWEVRLFFLQAKKIMIKECWGSGPSGQLKRTILAKIETNRILLLREWEKKVAKRN